MSEQPAEAGAGRARGWWRPLIEPEDLVFEPEAGDRYVVVDDIAERDAVLVVTPWPQVDAVGHLLFAEDETTLDVSVAALQRAVDREREGAGQPAARRGLRVGDVFWVRTGEPGSLGPEPEGWRILDVTRAARTSARAALLLAASPALRTAGLEPMAGPAAVEDTDVPEPPPAGTASPTV